MGGFRAPPQHPVAAGRGKAVLLHRNLGFSGLGFRGLGMGLGFRAWGFQGLGFLGLGV